jgi:hypothetical protein
MSFDLRQAPSPATSFGSHLRTVTRKGLAWRFLSQGVHDRGQANRIWDVGFRRRTGSIQCILLALFLSGPI